MSSGEMMPGSARPFRPWTFLLVCILLEAGARALRLPLFPIWLPLLRAMDDRKRSDRTAQMPLVAAVAYALAATATVVYLLGSTALPFCLVFAMLVPLSFVRQRSTILARWTRGWRCSLFLALVWTGLSLALGQFPVGSLSFEVFFTAVLTGVVGSEWLAGFASRWLVVALTFGLLPVLELIGRHLPGLRRAPQALACLLVCFSHTACQRSTTGSTAFVPAALNAGETAITFFESDPERAGPHVLFPEGFRTDAGCLACHGKLVAATDLPRNRKGIHEIHYAGERIDKACTFCHQRAGLSGFFDLTELGDRRTAYNGKCVECHRSDGEGTGKLSWKRRYR